MGTEWEGGERVKGSTAETTRKRPERPWTAARIMEVLRRCPLAIAQQLVHCAIALSTAVLDRDTKTMSVALLLTNNLDNSKQKTSNLLSPAPPPYSWSLLGIVEGPAPPPSSKISRSFDLAWNHVHPWFLCWYFSKYACLYVMGVPTPILFSQESQNSVGVTYDAASWTDMGDSIPTR